MKIRKIKRTEKLKLKNIYQLYLYELSPYTGDKINSLGLFPEDSIDLFMTEDELTAYFIEIDDEIIGFILIQKGKYSPDIYVDYYVGEFFILKSYQGNGYGKKAMTLFFEDNPGSYLIGQMSNNKKAINFWTNLYESLNIQYENFIESYEEFPFDFISQKFQI